MVIEHKTGECVTVGRCSACGSKASEERFVREACRLGASGYVVKMDAGGELLSAVDSILNGERYASRTVRSVLGAVEG